MKEIYILLFALLTSSALGQLQQGQRVEILNANSITVKRLYSGNVTILKGSVSLANAKGTFYCDSAKWWRNEDRFLAFGRIRYRSRDGVGISAHQLEYVSGVAFLRGDVELTHNLQTLFTPNLKYDTDAGYGIFTMGGRIVTEDGSLTCNSGEYFSRDEHFIFNGKIEADTEDFILKCSRMEQWPKEHRYLIPKGGSAQKKIKSGTTFRLRGSINFGGCNLWKESDIRVSSFYNGVQSVDSTVQFEADSLFDNGNKTELFGKQTMAKWADWSGDSLEIHAFSILKSEQGQLLHAKGKVQTFQKNVVCVSHTLRWDTRDSILRLGKRPIVWTNTYILSCDTLEWHQSHSLKMDSLYGLGMVNMVNQEDTMSSNELSGRHFYGYLNDDGPVYFRVSGNAQAIVQPDLENRFRATCSDIELFFTGGNLDRVTMRQGPKGEVTSPVETMHLPGFTGESAQRPVRMEAISGLK
jgi:hypothetical protein